MSELGRKPGFLTGVCKVVPAEIQVLNPVDLARPVVSAAATGLQPSNSKTIRDDTKASNHHCALIKLYSYKQAEGQIGATGCNIKTSARFVLVSSSHASDSV